VAEGDLVMLYGRFSGHGLLANLVVVDILRLEDGMMVEHWDVIQDEATREKFLEAIQSSEISSQANALNNLTRASMWRLST